MIVSSEVVFRRRRTYGDQIRQTGVTRSGSKRL